MQAHEAMEQANCLMAHAWMVRNFLKHAEEVEDEADMLEVHRTIFDFIRAVEPAFQRKDTKEYLRRLKGKLPKLRKAAEFFASEYSNYSTHTNFAMASLSLTTCVKQFEDLLGQIETPKASANDTPSEAD